MSEAVLVQPKAEKEMKFIPYGSPDEIKLSIDIVKRLLCEPTKSGKLCSDRDALRFMMMCQAKRLNPFESDAYLVGYDQQDGAKFSLITAHQAFTKRAELHPEFDGMKSGVIVREKGDGGKLGPPTEIEGDFYLPEQVVVGGWAEVHFKNRKIPTKRRIRLERFNSGYAQWKVDAAGMICKCAEADALRSSFPTMLGGLYLSDEIQLNVGPAIRGMLDDPEPKKIGPTFKPVKQAKPAATPEPEAAPSTDSEQVPDDSGLSAQPVPENDPGLGRPMEGSNFEQVINSPTPDPATTAPRTIQMDLKSEVEKVQGATFETFRAVAVALGWISADKPIEDYDELSDSTARKLYGARIGLAKALTEAVAKGIV